MTESANESVWASAREGNRVVLALYTTIVSIAALYGLLIGYYGGSALNPIDLSVITIPPTPLGFALYGIISVGGVLGLLLVLMTYASTLET